MRLPPPSIQPSHWDSLGAYSIGGVYRVLAPVWVWQSEGAELGHGVSTLPVPASGGSLNRLYSPILVGGDFEVRVEAVKLRFAPTAGGWLAEPLARILMGPLQGRIVNMGCEGSWSETDQDFQNRVTYFKPKLGKVIRL